VDFGRVFYVILLLYNPGLSLFKLSLLAFYVRVFPVIKVIRIGSYILATVVVAWALSTEFVLAFRCHPVDIAWFGTPEQQAQQCIPIVTAFMTQAVPTIVFDIFILLLPIRHVWDLKLNRGQKLGVTVVILMGFLVTIISIMRLVEVEISSEADITCSCISVTLFFYWYDDADHISPLFR
jgi:hypothetical protein